SVRYHGRRVGAVGVSHRYGSSSGTTAPSVSTIALNSAAMRRTRPGPRSGCTRNFDLIRDSDSVTRESLEDFHADLKCTATHAAAYGCQPRHRPCHRNPL